MRPIYYTRTSTKDQSPELQIESGIKFCIDIGLENPEIFSEKGSAYKIEKVRPIWESVIEKAKKEKRDIILWKYDRSFRNREEFYKFMKVMFEVYGIKVYSVTEPSIMNIWDMCGKTNTGNLIVDEMMNGQLKLMWNFLIQMAGEAAEEESRKKGERVKLAVVKKSGKTKSYKGKKWGRKSLGKKVIQEVLELKSKNPKITIREICKEVTYWGKNNGKKNISKSAVHKILSKNNEEKGSELECPKIVQLKEKKERNLQ